MILADINISTEAAVAIAGLLSAVAAAAWWGVKGWVAALSADRATLIADRNSWMQIALENTDDLERVANKIRKSKGQLAIETLAAVVPESSSPPTEQQERTASIATVRARQAMLRVDLELPPPSEVKDDLVQQMTENLKDKVDEATDQIKEKVDESGKDIKDQIDDIKQ